MEQEIAQLNIIVSQAANHVSALKAALARATKRKNKYKEQLELIHTIKVNNMMMEEKIKEEQQELERLKANPEQTAEILAQAVLQRTTPRSSTVPNNIPGANEDVDMDVEAEAALMEATIGRG